MDETPARSRILVVEDEDPIRRGLVDKLVLEGFGVVPAATGEAAWEALCAGGFDLVLLDVMLPGIDGLEVCRRLRAGGDRTPVIMLTARSEEIDTVLGLELGADDYVTKPFGMRELLARVRAALRRARYQEAPAADASALARFGEIEADFEGGVVRKRGEEVPLTALELKVLRLLYQNRGRVVSRNRFLDEVWGFQAFPTTRTVDFHVLQLRKKLEDQPESPVLIRTIHGQGYRLDG